jgi:hypothetical protein
MRVRVAVMASAAAALATACGHVADVSSLPPSTSAVVEKGAAVAPPPGPPINAAVAPAQGRDGYPPCPPSDAWGKDPLGRGVLVTVWSEHPDNVTALVRTRAGIDRARTEWIGPDDHFKVFDFPDVDHTSVDSVLILTSSRRCESSMDPATAAG